MFSRPKTMKNVLNRFMIHWSYNNKKSGKNKMTLKKIAIKVKNYALHCSKIYCFIKKI